jgi:predicted MFS family arabinose efflux permease
LYAKWRTLTFTEGPWEQANQLQPESPAAKTGKLLVLWIWFGLEDNPALKKGITQAELDELKADKPLGASLTGTKMTFWDVLRQEPVWKSFFILFFSNITAWGFQSWLPSYLVRARGISLSHLGFAASLPFFAGTVGWALGGWVSDHPFKHNRKIPLIAAQWVTAILLYKTYTAGTTEPAYCAVTPCWAVKWMWSRPRAALCVNNSERGAPFRVLGGSRLGVSAMDSRNCQTLAATPA